jgi:hypothetical protein
MVTSHTAPVAQPAHRSMAEYSIFELLWYKFGGETLPVRTVPVAQPAQCAEQNGVRCCIMSTNCYQGKPSTSADTTNLAGTGICTTAFYSSIVGTPSSVHAVFITCTRAVYVEAVAAMSWRLAPIQLARCGTLCAWRCTGRAWRILTGCKDTKLQSRCRHAVCHSACKPRLSHNASCACWQSV